MDIKTVWIQVVSYLASVLVALLGGLAGHAITVNFPDMPADLATSITGLCALGPGYFMHHYLDGLLGQHKAAIADVQAAAATDTGTITDQPAT